MTSGGPSPSTARVVQGIALIVVGVAAVILEVWGWSANRHLGAFDTSKEPVIVGLGILAIIGGVGRMLGKIGH
ncbi:hypothetical protein [Amnibacterium kyonggiense]|uniref:Uncharacterized protein n=1 Tax=Amnibacterium kyonggiense TaxID=595671 RepID=A0A4V3EA60_9MICO|nr:hypothetical protein [Amnibacterium kyonggiense]TDS74804.1 hypothetical protein CLV52_3325 [Amnibacterium kyonggiense]